MGNKSYRKRASYGLLIGAGLVSLSLTGNAVAAPSGEALVTRKCSVCHAPNDKGELDRIKDGRRTPEGWDMTVARMGFAHGVRMTQEERASIVKYLSDNYGLAPEETEAHRYIIDRTPSVVEHPEHQQIADTCARCHSYGRIAVQRRTEDDWRKLVHFHVGQYPAIEIQAGGRDRNWFEIATGEVSEALGKVYGYQSQAWDNWQAADKSDVAGRWRVVGNQPGRGAYQGEAQIEKTGDDRYRIEMTLNYADGNTEQASGNAILYTGHEWRATVEQGDRKIHQVFNLIDNGSELTGRWFDAEADAVGGTLRAVRADQSASATVLSVMPAAIKAGTEGQLIINGVNLSGEVDLGPALNVTEVVSRSADKIVIGYTAPASIEVGTVAVKVGDARSDTRLATYRQIDYVRVLPEHPLARVGGGGGPLPKVPAQLEAIGYANGPDGQPDTDDDVSLGAMTADWSLDNLNAIAAEMNDLRYAGEITSSGRFVPNVAGPNPDRKFGTNNVGELKVTATVSDGERQVSGSTGLVVTVQRFNDPPIR